MRMPIPSGFRCKDIYTLHRGLSIIDRQSGELDGGEASGASLDKRLFSLWISPVMTGIRQFSSHTGQSRFGAIH
jgi:hypothetical protein